PTRRSSDLSCCLICRWAALTYSQSSQMLGDHRHFPAESRLGSRRSVNEAGVALKIGQVALLDVSEARSTANCTTHPFEQLRMRRSTLGDIVLEGEPSVTNY